MIDSGEFLFLTKFLGIETQLCIVDGWPGGVLVLQFLLRLWKAGLELNWSTEKAQARCSFLSLIKIYQSNISAFTLNKGKSLIFLICPWKAPTVPCSLPPIPDKNHALSFPRFIFSLLIIRITWSRTAARTQ